MKKQKKLFTKYIFDAALVGLFSCLAILAGGFYGGNDARAQAGPPAVSATIDAKCGSHPGTFVVPAGKTAHGFKSGGLVAGKACHGGGAPENKGFAVRDSKNNPIYMWSQYKDQPPYEKGGPLSGLSLGPGEYTLSVAGGAGARIELSYKLK